MSYCIRKQTRQRGEYTEKQFVAKDPHTIQDWAFGFSSKM